MAITEGISQPLAAKFLNVLRGIACDSVYATAGKTYHIGIGNTLPPDTGDFTGIEYALNGYARFQIPVANAATSWVRDKRKIWNAQTILFGPATADWLGECKSVGVFADATDTVAHIFGHIERGELVPNGNYLKYEPESLVINMTQDVEKKSEILANLQNGLLLGQSYSLPGGNAYVGFGTKLNGDGTIEEFTTATAPGYQRATIPAVAGSWSDPGLLRQITNQVEIEFENATENWPAAKVFGIFTDQVSGNIWYANKLPADAIVRKSDNVIILVDKLIIKE